MSCGWLIRGARLRRPSLPSLNKLTADCVGRLTCPTRSALTRDLLPTPYSSLRPGGDSRRTDIPGRGLHGAQAADGALPRRHGQVYKALHMGLLRSRWPSKSCRANLRAIFPAFNASPEARMPAGQLNTRTSAPARCRRAREGSQAIDHAACGWRAGQPAWSRQGAVDHCWPCGLPPRPRGVGLTRTGQACIAISKPDNLLILEQRARQDFRLRV